MGLNAVGKVKQTTTVTLLDPGKHTPLPGPKGKPMTVVLHGPYSKRYKDAIRAEQQAAAQSSTNLSSADPEMFMANVVMACVESWSVSLEGDDALPCTPEMIRQVFDEHPWVATQLIAVFGDAEAFLERPKPA